MVSRRSGGAQRAGDPDGDGEPIFCLRFELTPVFSPIRSGHLKLAAISFKLAHADHVTVTSAGSRPKRLLHPNTIRVLRETFGIPTDYTAIGTIAIGHPKVNDRPSPSLKLGHRAPSQVVHRGSW